MQKVILYVVGAVVCFLGIGLTADDWKVQKQFYDAIKSNNTKKIEALLAANPSIVNKKIKYHSYPVLDAARSKAIKSLKLLVEKGANINQKEAKTGKTALYYLCATFLMNKKMADKINLVKTLEAAKLLANKKGVNVNITDKDKRTPLVAFLLHTKSVDDDKKIDFITCLMENGAKNNIKSKKKEKALKLVDKKSKAYAAMKKRYKKKK